MWSFQFPRIWDIASTPKHVISFIPNFSKNLNFTSFWTIWVNSSPNWQGCIYDTYIYESLVMRSKWTPLIVHVNAFWFKFKIARVLCGALDYRQSMWTLIRKNIFQHRMRKHQDIDEVWLTSRLFNKCNDLHTLNCMFRIANHTNTLDPQYRT